MGKHEDAEIDQIAQMLYDRWVSDLQYEDYPDDQQTLGAALDRMIRADRDDRGFPISIPAPLDNSLVWQAHVTEDNRPAILARAAEIVAAEVRAAGRSAVQSLRTTGEVAAELGIDRRTVLQRAEVMGVGTKLETGMVFLPDEIEAMRARDWTRGRKPKKS